MVSRPPRKVHQVVPFPDVQDDADSFGGDVAQEIDFLVELLGLEAAHAVLDVASGAGRHALELARRGFGKVTAVDLSDQLLDIGARTGEGAGLKVRWNKDDPRTMKFDEEFDAALVLGGGAFGLMETDADNQAILDATFSALKPGGRVAVSGMSLLWFVRNAPDLSGYDPLTGYSTSVETIQVEGGEAERFPLRERYYVYPGLARQLEEAGFRQLMGFGAAPGRYSSRSISVEDPEILLTGVKPKKK